MATSKKTELILITYDMLMEMKPDDIKIRNIAERAGCTSTVIYKHFNDLDQLILYASIRFLENYIVDIQEIINQNTDALDMLLEMWRIFAKYAFQNVDVFDLLFWGKYKERLGDSIFEYYQMFPDELKNMNGLFTSVFFHNEIRERNRIIMHRAAATGYFSYDEATMLSDMQCVLFHGILLEYRDMYREPGKAEEGSAYFMKMLNSLVSRYRIK